jgi:uncharacterized repeat protein (TIGR02543 family)
MEVRPLGGDLQGTFAADALVMDSSKKIRAMFVRVDNRTRDPLAFYGVTLNDQPVRNLVIGVDNGSIEVSPAPGPGENPFREGTIVSLFPRPDEGYELGDWGLGCGGSGPCALTMNGHKDVTVSFQIIRHSLTVAAQPAAGGSVDPTGTTQHNYGDQVSVSAQASSGYLFAGFSGDCSGTGSCSVSMDSDQNVTANFSVVKKFSLQTSVSPVGGGGVSPSGLNEYPDGQKVSVTVTTATGYTFTGWTGNCSGSGSCSVTMSSDKNVTANFLKDPVDCLLTTSASPSEGGTVSPAGTNTYAQGASVTITASTASGYTFRNWSGDCSGSGTCSVTMNESNSVTANFSKLLTPTPVPPTATPIPVPTPTAVPTPTPTPIPPHLHRYHLLRRRLRHRLKVNSYSTRTAMETVRSIPWM